jgi:predicted flap endonuclease-1-like 5' DNA nuclease
MGDPTADRTTLPRVDEADAAAMADAGVEAVDVRERAVSYRDLLGAGVDRETATALRREFSLPYSTRFGEGIEDRSDEVSGLQDGERDWVAASASDWEEMGVPEYDPVEREPEDIWAERDRPTPVTAVPGVGPDDADQLADVGVTSVRQLGFVSASSVAEFLDLNVMAVRTWRFQARERAD